MNRQTNTLLSQLLVHLEAKGMKCEGCGCSMDANEAKEQGGKMLCEACWGESKMEAKAVFKCQECGKKSSKPMDECPKCGGSDIDLDEAAASDTSYRYDGVLDEEQGPVVAKVPSESNPEKEYEIRLGKDGNFYCSCPAWKNMKKPVKERICKHIKAWAKAHDMKLPEGAVIMLDDGEVMVLEMDTADVGRLLTDARVGSKGAHKSKAGKSRATSTQISKASDFVVVSSKGRTVVATYPEALEYAASLGGIAIGHSGDLEDGGDRTLIWASEEDAENDDGAKAIATIRARYA